MNAAADWGIGTYETFAPALEDAAAHLVRVAAPQPGERAVDLGCGSGNATLPLAAAGTHVTAVDPSLRLLGITAERARAAGHRITTSLAGAESLPLPGGDADLVISNFGVIFATDPVAAFDEVLRVLTPSGRFVFTAWTPKGPIAEVAGLMRATVAGEAGAPPAPAPGDVIAWHDPSTFEHLVPGGAAHVVVHEAEATFSAESAQAWVEQQAAHHPIWLSARRHVADDAVWAALQAEATTVLAAGSTAETGFAVQSPYVVVEVHPHP